MVMWRTSMRTHLAGRLSSNYFNPNSEFRRPYPRKAAPAFRLGRRESALRFDKRGRNHAGLDLAQPRFAARKPLTVN